MKFIVGKLEMIGLNSLPDISAYILTRVILNDVRKLGSPDSGIEESDNLHFSVRVDIVLRQSVYPKSSSRQINKTSLS